MSVCKMFVLKNAFCQCHLTLLFLLDGNYATLESCLAVRFSFVDIGALR